MFFERRDLTDPRKHKLPGPGRQFQIRTAKNSPVIIFRPFVGFRNFPLSKQKKEVVRTGLLSVALFQHSIRHQEKCPPLFVLISRVKKSGCLSNRSKKNRLPVAACTILRNEAAQRQQSTSDDIV